jgi:hypothetical protein
LLLTESVTESDSMFTVDHSGIFFNGIQAVMWVERFFRRDMYDLDNVQRIFL